MDGNINTNIADDYTDLAINTLTVNNLLSGPPRFTVLETAEYHQIVESSAKMSRLAGYWYNKYCEFHYQVTIPPTYPCSFQEVFDYHSPTIHPSDLLRLIRMFFNEHYSSSLDLIQQIDKFVDHFGDWFENPFSQDNPSLRETVFVEQPDGLELAETFQRAIEVLRVYSLINPSEEINKN
jgi:hypothetical protein